jgi:hypothetical protein
MRRSRLRFAAYGFAACGLAGCAVFGGAAPPPSAQPAVAESSTTDLAPITQLLELMSELPQGDPARQAELFQSAKNAASVSPTTTNRLRYALALATPGHGGSDPVAAQRQLSELLARPETLLTAERLLALVELQEVDEQLVLQAENQRLRIDDASRDSQNKLLAVNHRLAAEMDENARLRKALDEARAKLDAVTHIERSINDRGTSAPPPPK